MSSFHSVTNSSGARLTTSSFGARVVSVMMPDRGGVLGECVLGFDTEEEYVANVGSYVGATIGRVAGRTANAHFVGGGIDLRLEPNNGPHTLHGGSSGTLDRVRWDHELVDENRGRGIRFSFVSPAGTGGYPGTLRVSATYLLSEDNVVTCELRATVDAPSPVALTQHVYWNISTGGATPVTEDQLWIRAHQRIDMTAELVPTGSVVNVANTGFDFTRLRTIGESLPKDSGVPWPGIDHTYLIDDSPDANDAPVAVLFSPSSGRRMEVFSTEPELQVYLGCHLDGVVGHGGTVYNAGHGICLETVRFPDSPLLPNLATIVLSPDDEYRQVTAFRFSVD